MCACEDGVVRRLGAGGWGGVGCGVEKRGDAEPVFLFPVEDQFVDTNTCDDAVLSIAREKMCHPRIFAVSGSILSSSNTEGRSAIRDLAHAGQGPLGILVSVLTTRMRKKWVVMGR